MHTESRISFIEYKDPHGADVAYALLDRPSGKQVVIGRIEVEYDSNSKRKMFIAFDASGKQLYAPTANLKHLKKQFERQEELFVAQVEQQEKALTHEGKTIKQVRAAKKQKTKSRSR